MCFFNSYYYRGGGTQLSHPLSYKCLRGRLSYCGLAALYNGKLKYLGCHVS